MRISDWSSDVCSSDLQDATLCHAFTSLAALRAELDEQEAQAERLKQTIQQAMGDASRALFAEGEVTFKRSKDGTSLDAKKLTADHPELRSEEHTSELQSLMRISYAVFCLKKKKKKN